MHLKGVRPLGPEDASGFLNLMRENGCFCQYWDFTGDKNAWLERCAMSPERNEEAASTRIAERDPSFQGVVAYAAAEEGGPDVLVGYCRLATDPPKVRRLSVYRAVPSALFDEAVVLSCFYVHPSARNHGVAHALLEGAIRHAAQMFPGSKRLIALPRVSPPMVHDEEGQFGPPSIFADFAELLGGPHPVLAFPLT